FNGVAVQPDGKPVLVRYINGKIIAVRLNSDGSVDNSFSSTTLMPPGRAGAVAIQPDGKIAVSAVIDDTEHYGFSVLRYNPDGTLDNGFGNHGVVRTNISTDNSGGAGSIIIQPDGKILLGGSVGFSNYSFAMVRYL